MAQTKQEQSSLRSSFVVSPQSTSATWTLFYYGRSQPIPGTEPPRYATLAHTNIPRSGENGLPRYWEMVAQRWRAGCSDLSQPVWDWAAETCVVFEYAGEYRGNTVLAELLRECRGFDPVHMCEQFGYRVIVTTDNAKVLTALRGYLRGAAGIGAELEPIVQLAAGVDDVVTAIRRIQEKYAADRELLCWVDLEGLLTRGVY